MHLPHAKQNCELSSNAASQESEFSEFMWMAEEDLESFDHEVIVEVEQQLQQQQQLLQSQVEAREEEEAFLQQMLNEEEARETVYFPQHQMIMDQNQMAQMQRQFESLQLARQQQQQQQQLRQGQDALRLQQIRMQQQQQQQQPYANGRCQDPSRAAAAYPDFKLNPDAAVFVPRDDAARPNTAAAAGALTNGISESCSNGDAPPADQ
ncbi:hypothetical protein FHG87_012377 [Trinorchestia longiramus]|nr:hypothetical protein FHG87_012377 [Trinorchestia longiramus]